MSNAEDTQGIEYLNAVFVIYESLLRGFMIQVASARSPDLTRGLFITWFPKKAFFVGKVANYPDPRRYDDGSYDNINAMQASCRLLFDG